MTAARLEWLLRTWLPAWLDHVGELGPDAALLRDHDVTDLDAVTESIIGTGWLAVEATDAQRARATAAVRRSLPGQGIDLDDPLVEHARLAAVYAATVGLARSPSWDVDAAAEAIPRAGRPVLGGRMRNVRYPAALDAEVERVAARLGIDASEVYRRAVRAGLPIVARRRRSRRSR